MIWLKSGRTITDRSITMDSGEVTGMVPITQVVILKGTVTRCTTPVTGYPTETRWPPGYKVCPQLCEKHRVVVKNWKDSSFGERKRVSCDAVRAHAPGKGEVSTLIFSGARPDQPGMPLCGEPDNTVGEQSGEIRLMYLNRWAQWKIQK